MLIEIYPPFNGEIKRHFFKDSTIKYKYPHHISTWNYSCFILCVLSLSNQHYKTYMYLNQSTKRKFSMKNSLNQWEIRSNHFQKSRQKEQEATGLFWVPTLPHLFFSLFLLNIDFHVQVLALLGGIWLVFMTFLG